jgi:hypothetical protein
MGQKLIEIYKFVADNSGIQGKMKLAIETKIPSTKAAFEPDSIENVELFKEKAMKITGKDISYSN